MIVDFLNFTDRTKIVMNHAHSEAQRLGHAYTGTEHLLLGLLREEGCTGAKALQALGLDLGQVRMEVERLAKNDPPSGAGASPWTTPALFVLLASTAEAAILGQSDMGTGHLLLGLIRDVGSGNYGAQIPESLAS